MSASLQELADAAIARGPSRVVVDGSGAALPPGPARERGAVPHVIFIRGDGWTLGAPEHLAKVAEALWSAEWIGFVKRPSRTARPLNVSGDSHPGRGTPSHPEPPA